MTAGKSRGRIVGSNAVARHLRAFGCPSGRERCGGAKAVWSRAAVSLGAGQEQDASVWAGKGIAWSVFPCAEAEMPGLFSGGTTDVNTGRRHIASDGALQRRTVKMGQARSWRVPALHVGFPADSRHAPTFWSVSAGRPRCPRSSCGPRLLSSAAQRLEDAINSERALLGR